MNRCGKIPVQEKARLPDKQKKGKHRNAQYDSIIAEGGKIPFFNIARKESDCQQRNGESRRHADKKNRNLARGEIKPKLKKLEQTGHNHCRDRKEKRNSAAAGREAPISIAPIIVAPDREVPGIKASS